MSDSACSRLNFMRSLSLLIAALICLQGIMQETSAAAKKTSPTERYNAQVATIARRAIASALSKQRPPRDVSFKLRYVIGPDGKVYNVTIVSFESDPRAEKTAVQALKAGTFPPIPKDVRQEVRMDYLDEEVDVSYHGGPSTDAATPAFDKYNLRVHEMLQDQLRLSFATQPYHLEVDYEFYLDRQGHVTSMKLHAKAGGQWAEQVMARSIRALKWPSVPPQVFKELDQKPPLKIYGTLSWDPKA
jgi:hypothetical protein